MSSKNELWTIGIGDPTLVGWVTVVVYFFVALICLKATFTPNPSSINNIPNQGKSIKIFWLSLTIILVFLGINKQLDFQTLLIQLGREFAKSHGWFEYRRTIQLMFIITIGLFGITTLVVLFRAFHNSCSTIKIALTGSIILFTFIIIRASAFNHISELIHINLLNLEINDILELSGLAVIGFGGYRFIRKYNLTAS